MPNSVFVIVPCYNEAGVLAQSLRPLLATDYVVVVVDDGSRDDTPAILSTLPVRTLRHPINLGQGAALQTGMAYALAAGADVAVHFDADGQHRVEDIDALLAPIRAGDADVVLGSRFLRPEDTRAVPFARRWVLRGAVVVNGLLTGLWLTDAHNGFRALNRRALESIHLHENRMAHASEILLQIRRARLRVVEVPTLIRYTAYSRAKGQSAWNGVRIVVDLVLRRIFR